MWRALVEEGTILNIHLGSSGQLAVTAPNAPIDVMITLQPMNICAAAADLVWSRVFREFPDLRVALSEGGTGWIPYFLDRLDRTYDMHHAWTGQDFDGRMPSDVFRDHILTCFIADPVGLALRDEIGVDNICWEQDYPHSDSSWPHAPEELVTTAARYDVPRADLDKITHENAMRWYRFDPFAHRAREASTVGALRAEVAGHDVSIRSMDQGRHAGREPVSLGELAARATA
jgi:predicted TIM-barrel fold metal-dependent hydrolase